MDNKKIPLVNDVTKDQIEQWEQTHGEVKKVFLKMKKTGVKEPFIIGKPTRSQLDAVAKYNNEGKTSKVRDVLEGCILAGNIDIVKDPKQADVANTLYSKITDLLEQLETEEGEL